MTLDDCIKARRELRNHCQCLLPDSEVDGMDDLFIRKYLQSADRGEKFDVQHFMKWVRLVRKVRSHYANVRRRISEEVIDSIENFEG